MEATSTEIRAPRGTALSCKGWHQEAAMRMLMNNLDPEVAERRTTEAERGEGERAAGAGGETARDDRVLDHGALL